MTPFLDGPLGVMCGTLLGTLLTTLLLAIPLSEAILWSFAWAIVGAAPTTFICFMIDQKNKRLAYDMDLEENAICDSILF